MKLKSIMNEMGELRTEFQRVIQQLNDQDCIISSLRKSYDSISGELKTVKEGKVQKNNERTLMYPLII